MPPKRGIYCRLLLSPAASAMMRGKGRKIGRVPIRASCQPESDRQETRGVQTGMKYHSEHFTKIRPELDPVFAETMWRQLKEENTTHVAEIIERRAG